MIRTAIAVAAQDHPAKLVGIVVPSPAGGSAGAVRAIDGPGRRKGREAM